MSVGILHDVLQTLSAEHYQGDEHVAGWCVLDDIIQNQRWLTSTSVHQQHSAFSPNLSSNDPKFETPPPPTHSSPFPLITLLSLLELYVFNLSANEEHSCTCVCVCGRAFVCVLNM